MKKIEELKKVLTFYDYYSVLLNEKQKEIFEEYYHKDFSICEIAEFRKVSRQFISEVLKTVKKQFRIFEKKMRLIEKAEKRKKIVEKIKVALEEPNLSEKKVNALKEKLEFLI